MEKAKAKKGRKPGKKAEQAPPKPIRRKYESNTREEAKDLYLRGVALDRISKYLGAPLRTLTNWQTVDKWTEAKDPAAAAIDLKTKGYSVHKIAERLEVTERTVSKWLKVAKN